MGNEVRKEKQEYINLIKSTARKVVGSVDMSLESGLRKLTLLELDALWDLISLME